jgi:hypothetical protein
MPTWTQDEVPMRRPRLTTWRLMAVVAVIGGCLAIARLNPALAAWLVLLTLPVASWTMLQCERPDQGGPPAPWSDRLGIFLDALFWCVSLVVAMLVAMILISPWIDGLRWPGQIFGG